MATKTSKSAGSTAAPAGKKTAPVKPIAAAMSKSALIAHLADQSSVEGKQVKAVLAALESTMVASLHKKGVGEFTLPGLLKVTSVKVPAKPKRKGKNPFTGEEQTFAAKPASVKVKVRALKKLKDATV